MFGAVIIQELTSFMTQLCSFAGAISCVVVSVGFADAMLTTIFTTILRGGVGASSSATLDAFLPSSLGFSMYFFKCPL
ncbi:hypothetical protein Nepgr_023237 [Nepenthes gracilis]|uniref:Uncharacterized protein n=1 Tax=Nepenthes gracilis TaxID=150966 RepID=A0AAD3T0V7_NEPGR|nr:hypothetical protein Nepgr_023237 [Nepenthes gracilis]